MKRNDVMGSFIGFAIVITLVVVFIGGLAVYLRQGPVAEVETETDFSQIDNTISGL